ncbi:MFS transporter [Brevibacterium sediminis]|uniref:MFS transporter n=1 Tax=Brevibacterium sediminis TaxID=1857024 RepID=UPI00217558BB|nr:MFS transporter [Brevibacterium sediminis]MCS4594232.1 MFS transporter [Brevibacterium sediminis]
MSLTGNVADTELNTSKEAAVFKKINRRLLPFLLICYTFAYLDRVNIGYAKLHMQADIPGLTEAVFGVGAGLFFLAYAGLEIPSNLLMNRIGARKTITRIMVLWGFTSAAMLFVTNETTFYVLRILLGIFEAGFAPGIILYLTYWYPAKRMASAMGIYMLAGPIGAILGSAGSAMIIAATDNLGGLAGWQWMFLIQGLPCVVLGLLFWRFMVDRPEHASWLNESEREIVSNHLATTRSSQHTSSFLVALKNPTVYVMAIAYFGIMCGIYAVSFWLPTILLENGVTDTFANGLLSSVPYLVTIPVMVLLTRSSDRFEERTWHSIVPTTLGIIGLMIATFFASNFLVSFSALILAIAGIWGAYTVFWAVPAQHFGGTAAAGGIAFINTIGILGGFVAPTLMGFVKEATGSTHIGLLTMVGLLVVSVAGLVILPRIMAREVRLRKAA